MRLLAVIVLLLLKPCESVAESPPLAITHVAVVSGAGNESAPDQTVLVQGERITNVGPAEKVLVPDSATRVDGTGKYLIPGLWDMHVHLTGNEGLAAVYVANGVTGVRDMGTPLEQIVEAKNRVATGKELGPRIVGAGPILEATAAGPLTVAVPDAEAARRQVLAHKRAGADFIKVGSLLSREAYFAILDEAKGADLPVAGHLTRYVGAAEASLTGQRSIEHLDGYFVASSTRENELMAEMASTLKAAEEARKKLETEYTRENGIAYGKLLVRALGEIPAEAMQSSDDKKADALVALFVKNRTWQCPTLSALRAMQNLGDPANKADPRNKYVDQGLRRFWEVDPRFQDRRPKSKEELAGGMKPLLDAVRRMNQAGVPILAGTDCTNPYVFPGFSLHEELVLLVEAGLTPREALYAATLAPAIYLGREKDLGTIAPGKLADLVLLDSDPLSDIRNTTKIRAVVLNGKLLDKSKLDEMLSDVAAAMAKEDE